MLVILSGVAGAGKDTIKRELIKRMEGLTTIPSYTDRPPRVGDRPSGEQYIYVSKDDFEEMVKKDELYEYSVHHNHYYGTCKKLLDDKIASGKIIVKDIDVNGTQDLVKIFKDKLKIITIFLKVPKTVLKKRLEAREDNPDPKEIKLRLNRFDYEESKIGNYDYVIKNNNLEKTLQIIETIIRTEVESKNNEFE
ncbi:MAG: AAA family ATPase [Clostridia bacterium]|nr:AAA family ATPase [Clostridia bacterium]